MAVPQWWPLTWTTRGDKRYAARIYTWRMPASATKKDELALSYGGDVHTC